VALNHLMLVVSSVGEAVEALSLQVISLKMLLVSTLE